MRMHTGAVLALAALHAAGCGDPLPQQDPSALPDWSEGFDNVVTDTDIDTDTVPTDYTTETQPEPLDSEFNLSVPSSVVWPFRMRRWDSATGQTFPTEACDIDLLGVVPGQPIVEDCILEFNEGDLHWQGFSVDTHVPAGFCDYLFTQPYVYQTYRVGPGPLTASYTVQPDGSFTDEVNAVEGQVSCIYDYPAVEVGFSCCYGEYALTVTDAATGAITTEIGRWNPLNTLGSCFDGGAYLDVNAGRDLNSFPTSPTYFVDREALDIQSVFAPLLNTEGPLQDGYSTSIGLANYVALADHDGVLPTSLSAIELRTPQEEEDAFLDPDPVAAAVINPTYDFVCTDNAYEILGIIHLTVREWNTEAEFAIDGNWDAREGEEEAVQHDPFGNYDDLADWRNFGIAPSELDKTFVRDAD